MQNHIIQKVFVEITVNNKEKAYRIKDDIGSFLSLDVFPEIERCIRELDNRTGACTMQIPRLELDLNVKSSSLNAELKDKIAGLFREELSEISRPLEITEQNQSDQEKPSWVSDQEKTVNTFIYFLENGCMPWWISEKHTVDFMQEPVFEDLISAPTFRKSIISVLPKRIVQERIIHQLSEKQIVKLCRIILKGKELKINLENEVIRQIPTLSSQSRTFIWRLILRVLSEVVHSSDVKIREFFLKQFSEIKNTEAKKISIPHKDLKILAEIFPFVEKHEITKIIENPARAENYEHIQKDRESHHVEEISEKIAGQKGVTAYNEALPEVGQYLQNAGLVLIHPFIKTFFKHCDLLDPTNQELTDPELCAHLLHYIATGKTNAPEYDMSFEKFLCHIPSDQTINRHIKLSRKHKMEAKKLIDSVKQNWNPMKNSSDELLQNEFFQRSGKLTVTDYDCTLTVERKTQDILLDKLSWGIGLVKLPWKDEFLLVNW